MKTLSEREAKIEARKILRKRGITSRAEQNKIIRRAMRKADKIEQDKVEGKAPPKVQRSIPKLGAITVNILYNMEFPQMLLTLFCRRFPPPRPALAKEFIRWITSENLAKEISTELQDIWVRKLIKHIGGDVSSIHDKKSTRIKQLRTWLMNRV